MNENLVIDVERHCSVDDPLPHRNASGEIVSDLLQSVCLSVCLFFFAS